MSGIYIPKGAAREYSPLALNYIKGCDHGCVYCYVPIMLKKFDQGYIHSNVYIKEEKSLLQEIAASCKKHYGSPKQVFLSFLTDPYSHFNNETKLTRKVLQMLLNSRIPVSILTKGGHNIFQDLDIIKAFGGNIQVGGSLTFTDYELSKKWEKNSSAPAERFDMLNVMHEEGVRTWASMEPVIYPEQSLAILELTAPFVDGYKIGKLNHFPKHEARFNWTQFLTDAVNIMRKNNKLFYIKKDLLEHKAPELELQPHETDPDYMALKNSFPAAVLPI